MTPESMAVLHAQAFERGWSASEIEDLLAQPGAVLVASESGFALARTVLDEAELLTIVVSMNTRGRGQGRTLLGDLVRKLKDHGTIRIFLEVAEDNEAARALYRSAGFVEDGRRRAYYPRTSGAVDALLLSRRI